MEQNSQKQTDNVTKLLIAVSCILFAALIVGTFAGAAITSWSYAKAYEHGDIHICTDVEIDYQKAIFELDKCKNSNTINFGNEIRLR